MSQPSPDARAVVAAVDRLTTQVRRLADTRPTPTADAPTTCDASTLGIANRHLGPCVLRDGHDGPVHRGPEGETWASVVAEAHTLADGTEAGFRAALAADDEEQQRTHRREQLRTLLARLDRGGLLSPGDCTRLRVLVDTEVREANTARAVAAGNLRHVQLIVPELEQAQAAIERVRAYAAETARSMKDATNDHDIGRYDTAVCVLDALREDAERFDEAEDVESLRAKLDEATATLRRVRALHTRTTVRTTGGPADACASCELDSMSHPWPCPTAEALAGPRPDGTEQPTTKEN